MPTAPRPAAAARPENTAQARPTDATLDRLMAASRASFSAEQRAREAFVEHGLQAAAVARQSGRYVSARAVMQQLTQVLTAACRREPS